MNIIEFTLIKNSKSKGIKKGMIIILSFISLIIAGVSIGSFFTVDPILLVFGSIAFMISLAVFYYNFKTYNIVGYLKLGSNIITINQDSKSLVLEIEDIRYFDFEYKGYVGSYYPGDVVGGTVVSHDGTGNILEIGANSKVYKLHCLIEDERSAIILRNYVIRFNKSKQIKNG